MSISCRTTHELARRRFLQLAAGAAVPLGLRRAHAQSYPNRYVRFVVPFPPGASADPVARLIANRLSEVWGQQVVVDNKGGAGGNLAAQAVAQSPPDGYTMLLGAPSLATNGYIIRRSDSIRSVSRRSRFCASFRRCSSPFRIPRRRRPSTSSSPTRRLIRSPTERPGIGLPSHLSAELLKRLAGIEWTVVPYRGAGPALNDLIPGRISSLVSSLPGMLPHILQRHDPRAFRHVDRPLAVCEGHPGDCGTRLPGIRRGRLVCGLPFRPARPPRSSRSCTTISSTPFGIRRWLRAVRGDLRRDPETSRSDELAAFLQSEIEKWVRSSRRRASGPE